MYAMLAPSQLLLWILLVCLLAWTATFIWLAFRRTPEARMEAVAVTEVEESLTQTSPLANLATIDPIAPVIELATNTERDLVNATIE
jgi:hypothetical protein